jgi:photosystem II stability/assembly factor-like uncharacterized protein
VRTSPTRLIALLFVAPSLLLASPSDTNAQVDPALFQSMSYRNIGPFRGGRVTTVTGIPGQPFTYYMGATGGGVWKTTDAGTTWQNISDGYFNTTGIGSVVVAPSDPNVVYVGTGESPVRGVKTSHGDGVYKSTDGGQTWIHLGLEATRHISRILVHPTDPDRVWLGAQGNPWGPNEERGVYYSEDGGETWDRILYVNDGAGIVDMTMDASNPNNIMVTSWEFQRWPWVVKSGGPGSRVYKTTDGGQNWREVSAGLPDLKGKMGIAISPANPDVVYMAIERSGRRIPLRQRGRKLSPGERRSPDLGTGLVLHAHRGRPQRRRRGLGAEQRRHQVHRRRQDLHPDSR